VNTIKQVRTEFYNAINNDATLTALIADRIYWINRVTTSNTFPLITYQYFDTNGEYSFSDTGVNRVADNIIFQTDIYVDPQEVDQMDEIVERLKVVLNLIGYRNINSPITFYDVDIVKNIRPMRWEKFNV